LGYLCAGFSVDKIAIMAVAPPNIELELVGKDHDALVNFSDFRVFCAAVSECLRRSEVIVTGTNGQVTYRVKKLAIGSAKMTLEAVRTAKARGRDRRAQVVGFFNRTVNSIQDGKRVDTRLGVDDVQAFKKLALPLRHRTKAVRIDGTTLTPAFEANADRILNDTVPTDGSVTGRLEKINVHERNEFVLFPPIDGYSIVCRFPDGLLDKVREAIKRNVTVAGTMHYAPDSPFPSLVYVRRMDIQPNDDVLPTLTELRGAGAGCTGNMTAVEYVRSLRDE
jgi:hypothetical protein